MRQPTPEQFDALAQFAAVNGRYWKRKLWEGWMTGTGPWGPLQQVRNELGPTWLTRFRFPKEVR